MARLAEIPGLIDPEKMKGVSAMDAMEKAMANFQSQAMRGMISTNAGLAQTIAGSPHMELSKGGLEANVHQLQGTLLAQGVMSNAWQSSGKTPDQFKQWQKDFIAPHKVEMGGKEVTVQFDPRAFWLKKMSVPERREFLKSANDPNLAHNYQYAVDQGWIAK